MNITFLIGNGFDLSCGMKSRYSDIYAAYSAQGPTNNELLEKFKSDLPNWGDFEIELGKNVHRFSCEDNLLECLRDFKKFLTKYLEDESRKCLVGLYVPAQRGQAVLNDFAFSLYEFYKFNTHHIASLIQSKIDQDTLQYNFISFNYTTLFDRLLSDTEMRLLNNHGSQAKIGAPLHIHGTLFDEVTLGLDNEEQLINPIFSLSKAGKRAVLKPFFNSIYDPERTENAKQLILDSDVICVYGMSLGDSDLTWRNVLLEWLKSSKGHILFLYEYQYSSLKDLTKDHEMEIEDAAKKAFLNNCGIVDHEDSLQNQIFIPVAHNIFDFQHTTYTIGVKTATPPMYFSNW